MELQGMLNSSSFEERDLDEREQIEAELALIEKQLKMYLKSLNFDLIRIRDEEEMERLQKVIKQEPIRTKGESISPEPAPKITTPPETPAQSTEPTHIVQATTLRSRHRSTTAMGWSVTPANPKDTRRQHDELTATLLQHARRLKQHNLAIQELVEEDKRVVGDAEMALNVNTGRFMEQHAELKAFSKQSWATMWKLILLTLMVLGGVLGMFMLIMITSKY